MRAMSTRTSVQNAPDYFHSAQRRIIVILALALFCCASAQAATRAQSWRIENDQDVIPVLIQKNADRYDPSDLLQNWKNGTEYIFVESKDNVDELASFMKANEMDGAQSVHFVFANSPHEGPQTSNHVAINVSGFSKGFDAFQMACASPQ
jgi:hypothetical protein